MSLDLNKLEKVREVGNGTVQARCPACAEAGQDRKGEHLRIQPDGKFGCCVFPQDRLHRKRIFALAGDNQPRIIKVRVQRPKTPTTITDSVLGRLGRVFASPSKDNENKDESIRTLRTPTNSYAYGNDDSENKRNICSKLIEFADPVLSVLSDPVQTECETPVLSVLNSERLPYLTSAGDLVIPFDSPERYHWWKGGQSVAQTRAEVVETATTLNQSST
jgi:hypothetical protein